MLNVKLSDKQNKSVLSLALATVYRPPGPYTDFIKEFADFLSDLLVTVEKALIVGDFNIHVDNTNDALGLALTDLINSFGVKQNVTGPTHRFNHMLDLIISHGLTSLFYGWTEQPRPEKTKVVECVSLLTRNGVTPGISPFCRVPVRLIWNISPLSAAPSICPGNLHRSSCLPFIFLHKQTLAWLCQTSTMKSADISTNIPTLHASSLGTLTRPTSRKSCRTFINTYPVQPED